MGDFERKGLNLNNKLKWMGLLGLIPDFLKYKRIEPFSNDIFIRIGNEKLLLESLSKSKLKDTLLKKIITRPKSEDQLEKSLELPNLEWDKMYKLIYSVSIDSKSRVFQFKLLHNILYTNQQLYSFNSVKYPSNLCGICQNFPETIEHLFYNCNHTKALWQNIIHNIGRSLDIRSTPSKLCMILGDPTENINVNFVSLVIRKYVYRSKFSGPPLSFRGFILFLRKIYNWCFLHSK